jgi:hypothetical protein
MLSQFTGLRSDWASSQATCKTQPCSQGIEANLQIVRLALKQDPHLPRHRRLREMTSPLVQREQVAAGGLDLWLRSSLRFSPAGVDILPPSTRWRKRRLRQQPLR